MDLLDSSPHRVAPVPGTLERAGHRVLGEIVGELSDGQLKTFCNKAIYPDGVVAPPLVLNWPVVSIIIVRLGEETIGI